MTRHRYTPTQQRVLAGMALATASSFEHHAQLLAKGIVDFEITAVQLELHAITSAANIGHGSRPGKRARLTNSHQVCQALEGLAKVGDVIRIAGYHTWRLSDELTAEALRRYGFELEQQRYVDSVRHTGHGPA